MMECLGVELDRVNLPKLKLYNVYRPPEEGASLNMGPLVGDEHVVISGDLNTRHPSWCPSGKSNAAGVTLHEWLTLRQTTVWNDPGTPTRDESKTSPDVTISAAHPHAVCNWRTIESWGSDHRTLIFEVPRGYEHKREQVRPRYAWSRADWKEMSKYLEKDNTWPQTEYEQYKESPQRLADAISNRMKGAISRYVPKASGNKPPKPWWTKTLTPLSRRKDIAFKRMQKEDNEETGKAYTEAKQAFTKAATEAKADYWDRLVSTIDHRTDLGLMFRLVRQLDGKKSKHTLPPLKHEGVAITDSKEKANVLVRHLATVCKKSGRSVTGPDLTQGANRSAETTDGAQLGAQSEADTPITLQEVNRAIEKLKKKTSLDPEGLCHMAYKHLGEGMRLRVLDLCNASWNNASVPSQWRQAHVTPLPKPGKDRSEPSGYRPISLTSIASKIMETIIKDRLTFLIEGDSSVRAFTPNQGGFRIGRGTEEQLYTVTAAIDRNRRKGRYTCLLVFDLARAFDTVDHARLKKRMVERGLPLKLIRWVESFLKGRNAIFRVDGEYGASAELEGGVPQGSVLGPILFLLYIDDLGDDLAKLKDSTASLFADDVGVVATGKTMAEMAKNVRLIIQAMEKWSDEALMQLSHAKTEAILFKRPGNPDASPPTIEFPATRANVAIRADAYKRRTRKHGRTARRLFAPQSQHHEKRVTGLNGKAARTLQERTIAEESIGEGSDRLTISLVRELEWKKTVTLLGLTFDEELTFDQHVSRVTAGAAKHACVLRLVSGAAWGHRTKTLRSLYYTYVLPKMTYALSVYGAFARPTTMAKLESQHKAGLCAVTGCRRSASVEAVSIESRVQPISVYADLRLATLCEKLATYPQWRDTLVPTNKHDTIAVKYGLLKRRARTEDVDRQTRKANPFAPWEPRCPKVHISATLRKKSEDVEANRRVVERVLAALPTPLLVTWTDGSVVEETTMEPALTVLNGTTEPTPTETKWGGAGFAIESGENWSIRRSAQDDLPWWATNSGPAGKWATSYRAEQVAMQRALRVLVGSLSRRNDKTLWILTDSSSLLQDLDHGPHRQVDPANIEIWQLLGKLADRGYTIHLQFVYSHCGLAGNDEADTRAKTGASSPGERGPRPPLTRSTAAARHKSYVQKRWSAGVLKAHPELGSHYDGKLAHAQIVNGRKLPKIDHLTRRAEREIRQIRTGQHRLLRNWCREDYDALAKSERSSNRPCPHCGEVAECPVSHLFLDCGHEGTQGKRDLMWEVASPLRREGGQPVWIPRHEQLWRLLFEHPETALEYLQGTGLLEEYRILVPTTPDEQPTESRPSATRTATQTRELEASGFARP
ncbi:putative RNA-directed DNA polymerase from transposon X-element [Diplonema papillatum]|nr:putative RNA-directed DNA polymerase from transposon X-element [Diplonema papillatum]KAJ9436826.1 putative RNA-directed DNA polymerase from transposon X-element [Diplonema papillatum]KAJ9437717.1 putative RNA-directed DNA polymerase from transposon X-element [Diplonema papillatum]KAJ9438400.1 putative RNA-directed DNA polymerase from transposon X-element [Diplonema papillatum]KAJ9440163.1 putative RNA-directed DNA polymerase from transposon X-element [Diplonema papillatum]